MVKRQVPLERRLRANAGKIANGAIWLAAAVASGLLYLVHVPESASRAVAVVRQHAVLPPESGRLARVGVVSGQQVSAGDELAVVEVPGLTQELAAAQAQLFAIQADDADAVGMERRYAKDVDAAQARWLSARVSLESQRATLVGIELESARLESPGAAVPVAEIEAKRAERDALRTEIAARADEVAALEQSWVRARERAGTGGDAALEARIAAAAARVEGVRSRAEACVLRAQASGTITSMVPAPGSWIQAGVPALTFTEASTQEAVVYLSPSFARELRLREPVSLVGPGSERIEARVAAIGPAIEVVPIRQARDPSLAEWGVPVTLVVADAVLTPGEAFTVEF